MTKMESSSYSQNPRRFAKVFWFICRWWFKYGVFGGILFLYSLVPFVPLFCHDCSNLEPGNLIWALFFSTGVGAPIGAVAGLLVGGVHAVLIGFWVYYPVKNIPSFRRRVMLSNIALPTGLMVFSTIFLISLTKNVSELPTVLYIPVIAYFIVILISLLVSRKFLKWWLRSAP